MDSAVNNSDATETSVVRRLNGRILPVGYIFVLLSFVNKNNISFAANELCIDLQLDKAEYGLGVTLLSTGFALSRLVGDRWLKLTGASIGFASMSVAWGAAGVGLGLVQKRNQFYLLATFEGFALGNAYPGIIQYFATIYPKKFLDSALAAVTGSIAMSIPFASVLSEAILAIGHGIDIEGWRLILILEGFVSIMFSVAVWMCFPRTCDQAKFLNATEKTWLQSATAVERDGNDVAFFDYLKESLSSRQVLIISISMIGAVGVEHSLMYFLNLVIRTILNRRAPHQEATCGTMGGHQMLSIALTAIPYLLCSIACYVMGRYADRIRNRRAFTVATQTISGLMLLVWVPLNTLSTVAGFFAVSLSIGLSMPPQVTAISLAMESVSTAAQPMVLSLITFVFSFSGLMLPGIVGKVSDVYGYDSGMTMCGIVSTMAGLILIALSDPDKTVRDHSSCFIVDVRESSIEESWDDASLERPLIGTLARSSSIDERRK